MPQIVELPSGIEVEFPDDMAPEAIDLEVRKAFPALNSRQMARVPEPGGSLQLSSPVATPVPQAFPIAESRAGANIAAKTPELSVDEAEQILTTPNVSLPRMGEEGTLTRGLSEVAAGVVEQALLTPASPILGLATVVPGVRAAAGGVFTYAGAKSAIQKAQEYAETGNKQALGEAIGAGALSVLGGVATVADIAQSRPGKFASELAKENLREKAPLTAAALESTTPSLVPESRRLPAPRTRMPEFAESTLEPGGPPPKRLPAPGAPLGPREAGYRIKLPIEPESAKAARERWSKPIDVEAQVEGADALRQMVELTEESKTPGKPYEPPSVNVDLRQLEKAMQRNTVSKVESWADQVIQDRLRGVSANPFLDPELLAAASVKGAILFKRGVVNFADWSAEMRQQFGRGLEDQLPVIFEQSKGYWETQPATLRNAWDKFNESNWTVKDLADEVDALVQEGKAPANLGKVVQRYRDAVKTDREQYGERSGLPEEAGDALVSAVERAAGKRPKKSAQPDAAPTAEVVDVSPILNAKTIAEVDKATGSIAMSAKTAAGIQAAQKAAKQRTAELEAAATKVEPTPPTQEPVTTGLFTPEALETPTSQTLGLKAPSGSMLGALDSLKSTFQKYFRTRGHLPGEVFAEKQKLDAVRAAQDKAIGFMERELMDELAQAYGLNKLQLAGGGSKRIPPAAIQLMDDYLRGRVTNPSAIPPNVRGVLDTMRAEIEGGSRQILDVLNDQLSRMKAGSPEAERLVKLIDTITRNMDVYVHRSYKFFDNDTPAPQWYADLNPAIRQAAEDYLINSAPTTMTRPQAQSLILDWLSDLKEGGEFGSAKLGSKDLSIFMKRKSIAPELRAVLGEYRNPLVNYAKSTAKMADWVAKQKFLDEVKRKGMGTFLFEEGTNPPGFNAKIAADGSSTMSPLNGLRTTQEIADAFKEFDTAYDPGTIARSYLVLNAWTKIAATALSVMTQARNLIGRPLMAGMAGHWQVGKAGRSIKAIYQDFAGRDATWHAYLQDAAKHGVVGDTARAAELRAVIKDAALQDVPPPDLYSWSLGRFIKKYGYDVPVDFYRLSDELGNIFAWENEKAIQAKINPRLSPEEIKVKAAEVVRNIYPIYSLTPKAVKSFRHVAVVGPFVTFPFQMFRTAWNAIGLSIHEIRSANPVERAVGYKRLASQVATISATYAIEEMGRAWLGIDKQQEEDFRRFQPEWSRNSRYLFTGKDQQEAKLSAVNLSYTDPYSYLTDTIVAAIRGIGSGEDPFEVFAKTTEELFRPWISEQMLAKAIIEARNGKTDTGREIVNPTDDTLESYWKRVAHVMKALQPGTVQRIQKRILPAARNEQPVYGRKLELGPEIARELTGFAVEQFSFKDGLAFRARAFTDQDRAAESVFHQTLSRTETTTQDDLLNAYKEADARRFEAWQELRKDFLAAVRQGVATEEAKKVMEARGVTKRDANLIARGRYEPMPLSDQAKKRARERKRELPIGPINQWRRENMRPLDQ